MANIDPSLWGLVGAVFGGVGLRFAEHWLNKDIRRDKVASRRWDELSKQIDQLNAEKTERDKRIDEVEAELEECRDKYWKLRGEYAKIQAELYTALQQIKLAAEKAESTTKKMVDLPPEPKPRLDSGR